MTDITVPTAPALSHLPGVELCQTGTWNLSTGPATFTPADFVAAVAALDCPAVRRPVLKLGHVPTVAGQASIGYVDNMRVDDNWRTLVGDYAGMPGWLATPDADGRTVIASAFPDRSIEGAWDWRCQMGHTHPFVITAVSLLGAELPGVGTLASLQDVGRLYGVEGVPELVAASAEQDEHTATFTIPVTAGRKETMPNPAARTVAATVTSDDVRRAFYESPAGKSWDAWIEEVQLDPLQIIYIDDAEGDRYRVPVVIGAGDGADAVTFGDPVKVVIRYDDATVAASAARDVIRFASKAESRPGQTAQAAETAPTAPAAPADGSTTHEGTAMSFTDEQITTMRQTLGVASDADEATIVAALGEALTERADPPDVAASTAPVIPEGKTLVDTDQWRDVVAAAQLGAKAHAVQAAADRDKTIDKAWRDGKISAKAKADWTTRWDKQGAEATATDLAELPVVFPVAASTGYTGHDGSAGQSVAAFSDDEAGQMAALTGTSKEAWL